MQIFGCFFIMANHAPRLLNSPCIPLFWAVTECSRTAQAHTRRAAHTCWKCTWWACFDLFHWWMCLWLPFHLILPLHTPFLCVVISESTCRQYLLGDFLINHWPNVHAHTQTHTQQCFLMADQTLADRVLPKHTRSVTHPYGCILRLVVAKATAVHHLSF